MSVLSLSILTNETLHKQTDTDKSYKKVQLAVNMYSKRKASPLYEGRMLTWVVSTLDNTSQLFLITWCRAEQGSYGCVLWCKLYLKHNGPLGCIKRQDVPGSVSPVTSLSKFVTVSFRRKIQAMQQQQFFWTDVKAWVIFPSRASTSASGLLFVFTGTTWLCSRVSLLFL